MGDQSKNVLIGIFVIAALSVITFVILFLHPKVGDEGHLLRVRFADIDKIPVGTRVLFAGKPVGEVVAITEIDQVADERQGHEGKVFLYQLDLRVDSSVNVYNTDVISSKTSGLLGEKSVAITPKPLKAGEPLIIVNDQILFADESGGVEDTLNEIRKVTTTFDTVMISLTDSINEIKNQKIWETAGDTLRNVHDITAALNKPDELAETLINLRDTTARLLKSFDTIDSILVSGQKIGSNSERIVKGILEGEGSLGRILRRDEFYVNTNALLAKANTILNDINHYGLLFSSDKGWQRLRARRMNLLNQLSTPQEFRNYFNDELDQVATSLSRVSNVLEETESLGPCFNLVANSEYAKVFGELLRRVATLDESIKMFNLQLVERDLKQFELEPCE